MNESKNKRKLTLFLFSAYCLILVWLILFKLSFSFRDIHWLQGNRSINLIPFYYDMDTGRHHLKEVVLNLLIFVPFGVYLKMLDLPARQAILCGITFSLVMELCQYIFAIGGTDITDLITNTTGTVVGVLGYVILGKLSPNNGKTDKLLQIAATICTIVFLLMALILAIANT